MLPTPLRTTFSARNYYLGAMRRLRRFRQGGGGCGVLAFVIIRITNSSLGNDLELCRGCKC